jgi:HEAT repeat protein
MGHPPHTSAFALGKKRWSTGAFLTLCLLPAPCGSALSRRLACRPWPIDALHAACDPIDALRAACDVDPSASGPEGDDHESDPKKRKREGSDRKDGGGRGARDDESGSPPLAELERDLHAARPEKRRSAVKGLSELKSRAAWELILKALVDPDAMVADEAELELGRLRDRELLPELYDRAGLAAQNEWVQKRVAEAFGRMSIDVDGAALMRSASPSAVELSRTIVWSIERLALAKHLGGNTSKVARSLESLCRSKCDGGLRGAALQALCAVDKPAAQPLISEAMLEKDPVVRCAGLHAAQSWTEVECVGAARRLLSDPEPAVRAQAIENLEHAASKAAILALIDHMDREKRERLRYGILAFLRKRSGLAHGFDAAAWKDWADKIAGDASTGVAKPERVGPVGDTRVAFAGLNVISDRIAFLIDCSGSLWRTKVGDRTRKDVADEKLRAALRALPADTEFNVIPYTDAPIPWEKRLVPSRPDNVKRALEFFERCHRSGRGDFYGAVELALADPNVDTIVVLTDGAPTGGHRWNLDLMFDLLVEQNRFRKVAFDSILVDASKSARKKWAELAERTGGRSIEAKME